MNILVVNNMNAAPHSVRPELELILSWARQGHNVAVFCPATRHRAVLEEAGASVYDINDKYKISIAMIRALRRELRSRPYDIIYATNSRAIPNAAFAAIGFDVKVVCYRGTVSGLYRSDPTSYLTILHPRVDAVVCVSNAVTQYVRKKVKQGKVRVATIYKGHDLSWYDASPVDLSSLSIPADAFVAIAVARFRPSKGLSVLLQAAAQLAHLDNFHLLVVGSGADEEPYNSLVANSGMASRIHVLGQQANAPQYIAASDVLVQASVRGEGLPRSIVEGLAYGVPAVSTTPGGAKEILREGETGFIVRPNDPAAIAEKIEYLYNHRQQLKDMSVQCRSTVEKELSSHITAEKYIDFFRSLLT